VALACASAIHCLLLLLLLLLALVLPRMSCAAAARASLLMLLLAVAILLLLLLLLLLGMLMLLLLHTVPGMPNAGVSFTLLINMLESNSLFVSGCIHTPAAASSEWMLRVPEPAKRRNQHAHQTYHIDIKQQHKELSSTQQQDQQSNCLLRTKLLGCSQCNTQHIRHQPAKQNCCCCSCCCYFPYIWCQLATQECCCCCCCYFHYIWCQPAMQDCCCCCSHDAWCQPACRNAAAAAVAVLPALILSAASWH
jgi:hypothetical protein